MIDSERNTLSDNFEERSQLTACFLLLSFSFEHLRPPKRLRCVNLKSV